MLMCTHALDLIGCRCLVARSLPLLQPASHRPTPMFSTPTTSCLFHTQAVSQGGAVGRYATVALIDARHRANEEDLGLLCWGGGPHSLLAAASTTHIFIYSLSSMCARLAGSPGPWAAGAEGAGALPLPLPVNDAAVAGAGTGAGSDATEVVGMHRLSAPILGLQWTQDGSGLLVTDASGNITMLVARCGARE